MILNHHRAPVLVLALTSAAMLAPAASARPIDEVGPNTQPASQSASVPLSGATDAGVGASTGATLQDPGHPQPSGPASRSVGSTGSDIAVTRTVHVPPSGFDWGDAALGAAGMLSLLGLGAGAVVIGRRSRSSRPAVS
jgi:hypothetical protein